VPVPATEWLPVASIPALVSKERFAQAQAKLAQNRTFARRHNTAHAYLLRALASCGVCRASCLCRTVHPGYAYYVCRGKGDPLRSRRDEPCRARFAPAHQLDELVWQDLCALLTHPEHVAQALARAHGGGWLPQELQARRDQLRRGQLGLERQLERLTEAYLLAVVPLAEYQRRRQVLEQRLQAMNMQASQLEAKVDRQAELAGWAASAADFCRRVQASLAGADFAEKRQLVELLVDRVLVTDSEVEIRYVVPLSASSERVRFCHLRTDYFDPLAIGVDPGTTSNRRLVLSGRNGWGRAKLPDRLAQRMAGIATVGHRPHRRARQEVQQPLGLGQFRRLARRDHERDRPATSIGQDMTLGAVAAARATERLGFAAGLRRPIFLAGTGRFLMRADDGAVEEHHAKFEPMALLHQPVQALPHPEPRPADEGLRRHPPRSQLGRDRPPLGPVLLPPHNRLDGSTERPDWPRRPWPDLVQQRLEFTPLLVPQYPHSMSLPALVAEGT
jgi:hypothetical protein